MFGEFVWWQGVVEDRKDPLKLGRCRVRILGYHTDNKVEGVGIPTKHLPWAYPSQPLTSAAMNGIGTTPLGAVEGTWVFGFFRDGKNAQEPVMTGTFGGIPEVVSNPVLGFNDPKGVYPLSTHLDEPDTNRLARGGGAIPVPLKGSLKTKSAEDAPSLDHKRKTRNLTVPTAVAGDMVTTIPNTDNSPLYTKVPWNEPNPRYGGVEDSSTKYLDSVEVTSLYPFNHVRMSESGHVEEWDDTPTAERLHKYHKTGTFEEIQPDGTKVTKIVGNEYEITLGYKDVLIKGTCNVTVGGDCRMLYQGDLVQEVYGDYHLNVHGDKRTKINGNEATEVLGDRKIVINGFDDLFIAKNRIINIGENLYQTIGGTMDENITKAVSCTYNDSLSFNVTAETVLICNSTIDIANVGNMSIGTNGTIDIMSIGNMKIETKSSCNVITAANHNITVGGNFKKKITGTTHKQYMSPFFERWDGDKWSHTGANTYSRHDAGVDHGCNSDPVRTGANLCTDVESSGL